MWFGPSLFFFWGGVGGEGSNRFQSWPAVFRQPGMPETPEASIKFAYQNIEAELRAEFHEPAPRTLKADTLHRSPVALLRRWEPERP